MPRIATFLATTVVFLAGCGSATKTETEAEQPSTPSAAAASTAPVAPPPGKTLATAESTCTVDKPSPPINLTRTTVAVGERPGFGGTTATIEFFYDGTVPTTGAVLWSLTGSNPEGKTVQAGWKTVDGNRSAYFYFPNSEGQQQNMDGFADENTPGKLGIFMPQAALDILGPTWWWSSAVSVDGRDIATC